MQKTELNDDVDMKFSVNGDWHHDIWLPEGAQMTEIHLRVYSFAYPENIYHIQWGLIRKKGNHLQIPIDAAKLQHSEQTEAVRLAFDITYFSDKASASSNT
jgi:hypothetical protein